MFDPSTSVLAGMSVSDVQSYLSALQQCLLQLGSGAKISSASYTQGDGAKSISYTKAQEALCVQMIRLCQAYLGVIPRPRRAIGVRF